MRIEPADASAPESQALVAAYLAEIAALFPGGFDATSSVPADPEHLSPPYGAFLVVRNDDGAAVGCGGLKMLDDGTAELKRMWLAPEARGRGAGSALLGALEQAARGLGATRAVLDTNGLLTTAIELYRRRGWRETEPYNDNPYATHWFAKELT